MARTRSIVVLSLPFLFLPIAALAQDTNTAPAPAPAHTSSPRVVADIAAGTSFGNTEANWTFNAGADFVLNSHIQVGGEFGHFQNIITKSLHDDVRDTAASLSPVVGAPVTFDTSVPAGYGLGTVRLSKSVSPIVEAFADVGVGVAHVHSNLTATAAGTDVSGQILETVTLPPAESGLYATLGGGFSIHLGQRTAVDAGYRYGRIAVTTPMNTNSLYGGLRLNW